MGVEAADLKLYKAAVNDDTVSNGGVISTNEIVTNVKNNLIPDISDTERQAGGTRYRKAFLANKDTGDAAYLNAYIWNAQQSPAADYFRLKAGTDTDTQADSDDYTDWLGTGSLATGVSSGATSLTVDYDAADGVYDGTELWIFDGVNSEYATVSGSPSWSGNQATIALATGLANGYAAESIIASMVNLENVETSFDTWNETSTSGTYDESTYPPTLFNIGTVTDSWTLTFSDATNFLVSGSATGSVGSGTTGANFKPANPNGGYFFELNASGWGGTWSNGDTITFNTIHSAKGFWVKEIWGAGIGSQADNTIILQCKGQSS